MEWCLVKHRDNFNLLPFDFNTDVNKEFTLKYFLFPTTMKPAKNCSDQLMGFSEKNFVRIFHVSSSDICPTHLSLPP
jgi:hypothetical protein